MNRHIPYDFLTEKLAQMPAPDTNALWQDMKVILDREMPEEKRKRRFIVWFFSSYALIAFVGLSGIAAGTFYLNSRSNSNSHNNNNNASATATTNNNVASTKAPSLTVVV